MIKILKQPLAYQYVYRPPKAEEKFPPMGTSSGSTAMTGAAQSWS